jgi:hypothetical protein
MSAAPPGLQVLTGVDELLDVPLRLAGLAEERLHVDGPLTLLAGINAHSFYVLRAASSVPTRRSIEGSASSDGEGDTMPRWRKSHMIRFLVAQSSP